MKAVLLASVFVVLVCGSYGQRTSTKNETFYCLKLSTSNQLKFEFRIDLNNDPQGAVTALNSFNNAVSCTISYNSTTKVYTVESVINLSNNQPASNDCGFSVDASNTLFTWRLKYAETPNGFSNANGGLNSIYTATCNITSTPDDTENAAISPVAPNIDVVVNATIPPISLVILYEATTGSGNFQLVTSSTPSLPTGTKLKIQLQVAFVTFEVSKIYGVGGLRTRFAGNINFNNAITFFNDTGCPISTYAPSTSYGFLGPTTNTVSSPFLATTDEFLAWKFDDSNFVYIEVRYETCRANTYNQDSFCRDPCNNPRTSSKRRRRNVEERREIVAFRIFDPNENTTSQQTDTDRTVLYVGMGVGVFALLALLTILVYFLVIRTRRQHEKDESKKVPREGFTNQVTY